MCVDWYVLSLCTDHTMVAEMLDFCREQAKKGLADAQRALADRVLHTSQLRVLYNLEVRGRGGEGRGRERGGKGRGGERGGERWWYIIHFTKVLWNAVC